VVIFAGGRWMVDLAAGKSGYSPVANCFGRCGLDFGLREHSTAVLALDELGEAANSAGADSMTDLLMDVFHGDQVPTKCLHLLDDGGGFSSAGPVGRKTSSRKAEHAGPVAR